MTSTSCMRWTHTSSLRPWVTDRRQIVVIFGPLTDPQQKRSSPLSALLDVLLRIGEISQASIVECKGQQDTISTTVDERCTELVHIPNL